MHYFFWVLFDTYCFIVVKMIVRSVGTLICTFYYILAGVQKGREIGAIAILESHYNGWDTFLLVMIVFCLLAIPKTSRYKQIYPLLGIVIALLLLLIHAFIVSLPLGFVCLISLNSFCIDRP